MAAPNYRMYAPASGNAPGITVNGRFYTAALGTTLDVPVQDAALMSGNGWTMGDMVGATSARPSPASQGQRYYDTTLAFTVQYDGKVWRRPDTGASA